MRHSWSPEQDKALRAICAWRHKRDQQVSRLHGYAGTGKTTVAVEAGHAMARNARFCALSGKAAMRLIERGAPAPYTMTAHRLIYKSTYDEARETWIRTRRAREELDDVDLIVIDEASMINSRIASDLLSFGRPVLSTGDSFQLPPPTDEDDEAPFMESCDALLSEVHRQALHSPILRAATALRNGEPWARYADGKALRKARSVPLLEAAEADIIIVGRHTTRRSINRRFRHEYLYLEGDTPHANEIIVCLQNDYTAGVFNGETFQIDEVAELDLPAVDLELTNVQVVAEPTNVRVPLSFFQTGKRPRRGEVPGGYQHFDYGYALTCHKAQGSSGRVSSWSMKASASGLMRGAGCTPR